MEKNKRMNKKNEDLLQSIQRMEEKIKNLTRENVEMVSAGPWAPGLRPGPPGRRFPGGPSPAPPPPEAWRAGQTAPPLCRLHPGDLGHSPPSPRASASSAVKWELSTSVLRGHGEDGAMARKRLTEKPVRWGRSV